MDDVTIMDEVVNIDSKDKSSSRGRKEDRSSRDRGNKKRRSDRDSGSRSSSRKGFGGSMSGSQNQSNNQVTGFPNPMNWATQTFMPTQPTQEQLQQQLLEHQQRQQQQQQMPNQQMMAGNSNPNNPLAQQQQIMSMMQNLSNGAPPPPPPPPSSGGGSGGVLGSGPMDNMQQGGMNMNNMMNQMNSMNNMNMKNEGGDMNNPFAMMMNQMQSSMHMNNGNGMGGGSGGNMGGGNGGSMGGGNMAGMGGGMNNMADFMKAMQNMANLNNQNMGQNLGGAGAGAGGGGGNMMQGMKGNMPGNMPQMNQSVKFNKGGDRESSGADTKEGSNEPAMIGPEKPDKGEELEGDPEGPRESGMIGLIPTMDPNLAAAWGGWVMTPDGQMTRQPIVYHKSVLYPPNPNAVAPTLRDKPPGCRTIFIGGVPDKADEEVLRDVFEKCGPISTIRINKKNFAHIRFNSESPVDQAVLLSGWRLKVDNQSDHPYTSKLHIDYAQARDDQQAYERQMSHLEREERLQRRMMLDRNREPSPPSKPSFSNRDAQRITEELKSDERYDKAAEVLVYWLTTGECNKNNSIQFFNMVQAAMTHVKKISTEKHDFEEQLRTLKEQWRYKLQKTTLQIDKIETVLQNCTLQKVWDHFTKAQRKNITGWKAQFQEAKGDFEKNARLPPDSSDDEDEVMKQPEPKKSKKNPSLTVDVDSLKAQQDAWMAKMNAQNQPQESFDKKEDSELKVELEMKENKINLLQQTLQGLQKQLLDIHHKGGASNKPKDWSPVPASDSKLVAILSTYMMVHPYALTSEAIWNHVNTIDQSVQLEKVNDVLGAYEDCFRCVSSQEEQVKKWKLVALY